MSLKMFLDSRFKEKEEKSNLIIEDNPYADAENFNSYNMDGERIGDKKYDT